MYLTIENILVTSHRRLVSINKLIRQSIFSLPESNLQLKWQKKEQEKQQNRKTFILQQTLLFHSIKVGRINLLETMIPCEYWAKSFCAYDARRHSWNPKKANRSQIRSQIYKFARVTTFGQDFSEKWVKTLWDEVFKSEPSKICGRQPLKNLRWYGLLSYFKFFKSTNVTWFILEYFTPYLSTSRYSG